MEQVLTGVESSLIATGAVKCIEILYDLLNDAQRRALKPLIKRAFGAALTEMPQDLTKREHRQAHSLWMSFLEDDEVLKLLIGVALDTTSAEEDISETLTDLANRFRDRRDKRAEAPFPVRTALDAFRRTFRFELEQEARKADSPLRSWVTQEKQDEILKRLLKVDTIDKTTRETHTMVKGIAEQLQREDSQSVSSAADTVSSPRVFFSQSWPNIDAYLVGRNDELDQLDAAWDNPQCNVFTVVAWGGVGKSALVDRWLNDRMQPDGWREAERVYAWSFYSQGSEEGRQASADAFIAHALEWFGDPDLAQTAVSPWDKGVRLAQLIAQQRTLLVLDGMEPLQHPPHDAAQAGVLKDPAVQGLLKTLARDNPGLCVVATRVEVADLKGFAAPVHNRIDLDHLSEEAGAAYLEYLGVDGTDDELRAASEDFAGHALALSLLGNYVADVLGGDIRRRDEVPKLTDDEKQGAHARRVMRGYAKWYESENLPELDILRMMGLFDRPAEQAAIDVLRLDPPIDGLTDRLKGLSEVAWQRALSHLRDARLLARTDGHKPGERPALDCHPLVREHFGEELERDYPEAWKEAHRRLYEYYCEIADEYPATVKAMQPLYLAVAHGCKAGRHQQALVDVCRPRIWQGDYLFNVMELGAWNAQLALVASYFDTPWVQVVSSVDDELRIYLLNSAGFALRALGRLSEALVPMALGLRGRLDREDWRNASICHQNITETHLCLGDVEEALDCAKHGVALAERCCVQQTRCNSLAKLAIVYHQAGRPAEAMQCFRGAEGLQVTEKQNFPFLFSLRGYHFCELLLQDGQWEDVIRRISATSALHRSSGSALDLALDNLSMGRALQMKTEAAGTGDFTEAADYLDQAVQGLRQAGHQDDLPRGLLARAGLSRVRGEFEAAERDLEETMELAERCGMRLFETDAHLEYARLRLAMADAPNPATQPAVLRAEAKKHVDQAAQLVKDTGYLRRKPEVEQLLKLVVSG